MADKKEGVLKRVVRDFGFIKLDGGPELFVHKSDYPGLMTEGSRVRCEESGPDPAKQNKTHAQNVEVLVRVPPAAPTAPAAASAAATIPSKGKEDASVTWRHDDPIAQPNLILVRIWIMFLHLGSAVSGLVVNLHKVDQFGKRTKVVTPSPKATTDGKGEAYFALYLTPDVEFCDLVAIADGKEYPYTWSKTKPAQAVQVQAPAGTPTTPKSIKACKHIKAEIIGQSGQFKVIRVTTLTKNELDAEGVTAEVIPESAAKLELQNSDGSAIVDHFETDGQGGKIVHLKLIDNWRADVAFRLYNAPGVRSESLYVRQPRPVPQTP